VIIGGKAVRLHDNGHATGDIDIWRSTDSASLSNLADALRDLVLGFASKEIQVARRSTSTPRHSVRLR
jgi:hypothetical protein